MLASTDPLRNASRCDADWAIACVENLAGVRRREAVGAYLRELYRLAEAAGIDAAILTAQCALETANWTSPAWQKWLNPAGIGITDTVNVGLTYQTGEEAARAHVVHAYAYVYGSIPSGHPLAPSIALDPRYRAVLDKGWGGTVARVADLTGKWASDREYDQKIVRRAAQVLPGIPDVQWAELAPPPPPPFTGADVMIGGHVFHAVPADRQRVRAVVGGVACRKWATSRAPLVRPHLAKGEAFVAHYWVEGEAVAGERRWWVTDRGTRIWMGGTVEKANAVRDALSEE